VITVIVHAYFIKLEPEMKKNAVPDTINPDVVVRGRMFLGTFDDSVSRNPWGFASTDAANLTNTLIYHALLGPRLCARVGNILYHRPYFEAFHTNTTPLLDLASTGFFQFHMKGDSFNDTIERRRAERTNSTLAWIHETGWANGSEIHQLLTQLQAKAGDLGVRRYSPSFHALFQELADRAVAEGTPEYRSIHKTWTDRFGGHGRTRSEFEKLCDAEYGYGSASKFAAMSTVNSVNHYSYALAMHEITSKNDEIPIVETNELKSFNMLTRSLIDSDAPLDSGHLDELISGEVFEVIHRNLRVPIDMFHRPETWPKLAAFVGLDRNDDDFIELKRQVLLEIRRALEGGRQWHGPLALERACREYSRKICLDLGRPSSKLGAVAMKLGLDRFTSEASKDMAADLLAGAAKKSVVGAATAVGYGVAGGLAGLTAGWMGGTLIKIWANVIIDLVSESTVYHTRRIVDRVRYESQETGRGSLRYVQSNVIPLVQAICVKQITPSAIAAVQNGGIDSMLDSSVPDLF
jgi:hypothetical protein